MNGKKEYRVRVLFDTGSQRTFVTAKAVGKIGLEPIREERVGFKAFGSKDTDVARRGIYKLSLGPVNGDTDIVIEASVVNDISTIANEHVEVIKQNYSHLRDLFFADVSRYQDTPEIDISIGAGYLWEFQNGETIRGGKHEPIAVKTTLGWVLSGPLTGERLCSSDCFPIVVNHTTDSMSETNTKEQCGHVPGVDNPADIGSRGVKASELKDSRLWWEGPEWLKEGKKAWPSSE